MNDFDEPVKDRKSFFNKNIATLQLFVYEPAAFILRFRLKNSITGIKGLMFS